MKPGKIMEFCQSGNVGILLRGAFSSGSLGTIYYTTVSIYYTTVRFLLQDLGDLVSDTATTVSCSIEMLFINCKLQSLLDCWIIVVIL